MPKKAPRTAALATDGDEEEGGVLMGSITLEKFDSIVELRILKVFANREDILAELQQFETWFLGRSHKWSLKGLLRCILRLRAATLDCVEKVRLWQERTVRREPVIWKDVQRSGTTEVNYLLKLLRDTERYMRTFDLPLMLGLKFGQRNPFFVPLPPHANVPPPSSSSSSSASSVTSSRYIKRLLPTRGPIRQDLLLQHSQASMAQAEAASVSAARV